mgnify:CR=1 FL=1
MSRKNDFKSLRYLTIKTYTENFPKLAAFKINTFFYL